MSDRPVWNIDGAAVAVMLIALGIAISIPITVWQHGESQEHIKIICVGGWEIINQTINGSCDKFFTFNSNYPVPNITCDSETIVWNPCLEEVK